MEDESHRPRGGGISVLRWPLLAALLTLLASCTTYAPRFTPENVAPPESLEVASSAATGESQEQEPSAERPAAVISMDTAVQMALARNRDLAVQAFSPEIAETAIAEARASFDPTVSGSVSYREQNRPGSASAASGSGSGTGAYSSNETIAALQAASTLTQETATIINTLNGTTPVTNTKDTGAELRVTQLLPAGAEVYVSGVYGKAKSSLLDDPGYSGAWAVGVTQPLLRGFGTDVNLVALRQARNDTAISDYAFREYVLALVEQVERAYWELALARETVDIRAFSLDLSREQLKLNEGLIAVGKLAGSAIVSARAEVASAQAALVDAQASWEDQGIAMWSLLDPEGQPPDAYPMETEPLPPLNVPAIDASASIALAQQYRPELAQARLAIANSDLAVTQTANGLLPQLDLFATYGATGTGTAAGAWNDSFSNTRYDDFEVGMSFSYAIGNRAEKARHRAAVLRQGQAEASVHALTQTIEAGVRRAAVEVKRLRERLAAAEQEVAQREEELRIERDQFRLGRSTNLDVLQVQRDLIQAKVDEASAHVGLLQSITSLYAAEGTLLTRRSIVLENSRES